MKKIAIFMFLCLCTAFLSAQTSFYAADNNQSSADNSIVRSWDNGNASITYYEVGLDRYVQYVDYSTGDSYRSEVPDYLQILDMYVLGDTVYYCGYSVLDTGGRGVVGYFDPSDFLSGIWNVNFHDLPVAPLTHVRKLVAQRNAAGGVEVIAIGEHQWYDTVYDAMGHVTQLIPRVNRHFLFCHDVLQNPVSYDTALVWPQEHYYDVLLTDHYVVFVGTCTYLTYNMICMRIIDRANAIPPIAPTPSPLDDIYAFQTGSDEVYSALHSTAMNQDSIATAYMHIKSTGEVSNRVRVFDIQYMSNVNSQEYIVQDKSETRDIVHIPADNSLVCLHDFTTPLGLYNSNFVYLDPLAAVGYLARIEFIKGVFYKSLTKRDYKFYLGSFGPKWFMKDKTNIGPYTDPYCPQSEKIKSLILDNQEKITAIIQMYPWNTSTMKHIVRKDVERRTMGVICNNP